MADKKRSAEEYIVMSISGASALCIAPFLFIRALNGEWPIAILDLFAVASSTALCLIVYFTGKVKLARQILASLCIAVVVGTIVLKGSQQLVWLYPAIIGVFFLVHPRHAAIFCSILVFSLGLYLSKQLSNILMVQYAFSTLITMLFSYGFADRMLKQHKMLKELSTKDALTGAGNRRAMEEKLLEVTSQHELDNKKGKTDGAPSLILIDLDEFKKVNDQYGHSLGDSILRDFSAAVSQLLVEDDHLFRFGGEEFVVVAESRNMNNISILAEEIRESIEQHVFEQQLRITISLGIAEFKPEETGFEWLGRADKAMYQAKDAGRNLCCVAA